MIDDLTAIKVLATVQHLGTSLPWLTSDGGAGQVLSGWGITLASLLLLLFGWINLAGWRCWAAGLRGLRSGSWWCPSRCRSC
jgi:hypothetical protein